MQLFFKLIRNIFLLTALLVSLTAWSQQPPRTDGELDPVEIEIVREREIILPAANRNFEKIPPRPHEPIKTSITYDFKAFNFQAPEINAPIRPLKLKEVGSSNVYGNQVSLGYGNYGSPYLEAFLNSKRDKNKLVGLHGWHTSSAKGPVDGKNSGSGNTGISVYGKTFGKLVSLSGKAGFENRFTHFYGYAPNEVVDREEIFQSYNIFSLGGSVSNTKNTSFAYELGGDFSYLADHYEASESDVDLAFNSSYKISDESSFELNVKYNILNREDLAIDADPRSLLTIKGSYAFMPIEGFKMRAGLIAAYENDDIHTKDLHLYPDIHASYTISPSVDLVGSLSGGMDKVSLHSISSENWWVAPNIDLYHTNRTFEFQGGVNARLGKKVEAHGGVAFANLRNLYYFINSPTDQSKFEVIYDDGSTKRSNFFASLSFAQDEKAKFMVRGDYYAYTPGTLDEAWHRPTYKLTSNASFNLYDKLLFSLGLITQGGMKALVPVTNEVEKLDPAFDLNFKTEYILSERFSLFVQLNNITSNNYPVFLYYPVRGFQALGGITWSF